jgi:YYY domain-containing protein
VPWIIWAIAEAVTDGGSSIWGKLGNLVPLIIILALVMLIAIQKIAGRKTGDNSALFASILLFTAILLTVGCELFYIRDVFNNRMNTVFRFYFQAWILFDIASAFAIYYLYRNWKTQRIAGKVARFCWWGLLGLLVACSLIYPVSAVFAKTSSFSASPTLDGTAWHRSIHAEEWEAISWMNKNIDGDPIIVTAPGGAYTDHGIVSEFTGLPTVLGWEGHEYVWRGTNRDYAGRREDIQQIYTSTNASLVQELLAKYDVSYVYVGRLETEMYGADAGAGLRAFMDVPFEINGVVIYEVKK